jgi:hypothetical protein
MPCQPYTREDSFWPALTATAARLGLDPEHIARVMWNESRINPTCVNPNGGARGLIQFMPATLKGLGYSGPDITTISATEQMPWVEKYFARQIAAYGRPSPTPGGVYQMVFYPASLKYAHAAADTIVASPSPAYLANRSLDPNHDGRITLGDLEAVMAGVAKDPKYRAAIAPLGSAQGSPSALAVVGFLALAAAVAWALLEGRR